MNLETAAKSIPVSPEKLAQWESGASKPTIRQAEVLAKTYKRPFALLFLPKPPLDFTPLQDFRRKVAGPLSTSSVFIIREIRQRQAWTKAFYEENGEAALPFVGRFTIRSSPATVANDILTELNIDPESYHQGSPIREWIEKAETRGIFVSKASSIHSRLKLDSDEFQAFAIADAYAPFIFINSEDWDTAQLFSLVHELTHIWINQSGISGDISFEGVEHGQQHPVEIFCNQVAANALLPEQFMNRLPAATFGSIKNIYTIARRYGVSSFAFLIRSLDLKKISHVQYRQLKADADKAYLDHLHKEEEKRYRQERKDGGPSPFLLRANRNGHLFTRLVMDAYRNGFIQPTEASNLLNTPVNSFSKLEAFAYR